MLKIIPENSILPILQGRLRGKKWIIGSGVFGYWLRTHELEKQRLFRKMVKNGDIVYDIGAHVGFYTLLAADLVGEKGKVFSFEPNPRNIFFLKKHIALNNLKNIRVFEAAVSKSSGTASFSAREDSSSGRLNKNGELEVGTITLDDLISGEEVFPPNVIKIDIEGTEFEALQGMTKIFEKYRPFIFLATHNEKARDDCFKFLKFFGYNLKAINGNKYEILAFT
jgi:FkbM family methyltransferase